MMSLQLMRAIMISVLAGLFVAVLVWLLWGALRGKKDGGE